MTSLALNMFAYKQLKVRYSVLVCILPLGLCFGGMGLAYWLTEWLADVGLLQSQFEVLVETLVFVGSVILFSLSGYFAGWQLNILIARVGFGWSAAKCHQVFQCSQVPGHWVKASLENAEKAERDTMNDWAEARKAGALRYIFKMGVLGCSIPIAIIVGIVLVLTSDRTPNLLLLFGILALIAVPLGILPGWLTWYFSERQYLNSTYSKTDD